MNDPIDSDLLEELGGKRSEPEPQDPTTTRYGYPIPPDTFLSLPIEEIRQWGKLAINARTSAGEEAESSEWQTDLNWYTDTVRWSNEVLELVVQAIGGADPVLLAYIGSEVETVPFDWRQEGF